MSCTTRKNYAMFLSSRREFTQRSDIDLPVRRLGQYDFRKAASNVKLLRGAGVPW